MESLNFQLTVKTPTILVYNNKRIRTTFHKDGLIQVDSFTGTFPETDIESIASTLLIPSRNRFGSTKSNKDLE